MSIVRESGINFMDMVSFLADPEKIKAEYQRLEEARAGAQKLIDLVGPAGEVIRLRDEAMRMNDDARSSMLSAKSDAVKILSDAKGRAVEILAQASGDAEAMKTTASGALASAMKKDEMANEALTRASAIKASASRVIEDAVSKANKSQADAEEKIEAAQKAEAKFEAAIKTVNSRVAALNAEVNV